MFEVEQKEERCLPPLIKSLVEVDGPKKKVKIGSALTENIDNGHENESLGSDSLGILTTCLGSIWTTSSMS